MAVERGARGGGERQRCPERRLQPVVPRRREIPQVVHADVCCRGDSQPAKAEEPAAGRPRPRQHTSAWTTCGISRRRGTTGCSRRSGQRWRSPPPRAPRSTATGPPSSAPRCPSWDPLLSCSPPSSARPSPSASSPPSWGSSGTGRCFLSSWGTGAQPQWHGSRLAGSQKAFELQISCLAA